MCKQRLGRESGEGVRREILETHLTSCGTRISGTLFVLHEANLKSWQ